MVRKSFSAACALSLAALAAGTVAAFLCGCSGNGLGLDEYGRPLRAQPAVLTASFAGLRVSVIEPQCLTCHFGPSAAGQLDLSGPGAYTRLAGAGNLSREKPGSRLIVPGEPDSSYLYLKTAGTGIVEARMPKDRAPLSPAELDSLKAWILRGAAE
jgi:hypothetical protein